MDEYVSDRSSIDIPLQAYSDVQRKLSARPSGKLLDHNSSTAVLLH